MSELDGKAVMSVPGSAWLRNVEATFDIKLNIIPLNYGLAQFMADKNFIQQCFITNEPFFVQQNGANPKCILLAQPGYDPYRVVYTSRQFIEEHPERVRAFAAASIKGWETFLFGDPTAAKALIASRNENMSEQFMEFSRQAMLENHLVEGDATKGERVGVLQRSRLTELADRLFKWGILREPIPLDAYVTFEFLTDERKALVDSPRLRHNPPRGVRGVLR
ncbi:MAG: ABC transporter substrate-binding protein [Candidatus Synoicihabitans palmerolidicus]|nr:ABC transporter substrate-binding protein [Candidatus Synoicihabitans palmerolidicus]